nr:sulfated surface glycoprotein 185-like [Lolium perenne]
MAGDRRRRSPPLAARALDGHPQPRHRGTGHPLVLDRHAGDDLAIPSAAPHRLPGRAGGSVRPWRACAALGLTASTVVGVVATGSRPLVPPRCPRAFPSGGAVAPSHSRLPAWVTATEPPPAYSAAPAPPPLYTAAGDPPRPSFPEPTYARSAEPSAGRAGVPRSAASPASLPTLRQAGFCHV